MKKAVFITTPDYIVKSHEHPWKTPNRQFNSKDIEYVPEKGICAYKKNFEYLGRGRVTLRATALGLFDLYLNGERVGRKVNGETVYDELKPEWTDYTSRVFEYEYDITDMCGKENTLVATVANGWWSGRISFGRYGFKKTAFCAEIELQYSDGSSEIIPTGSDWQTTICGPVMRADIWDGEYYDAREIPPYSPDCKAGWNDAQEFTEFEGELYPHDCEYVRVRKEISRRPLSAVVYEGATGDGTDFGKINIHSKSVGEGCEHKSLKAGECMILDFGQNIVGRPKIIIRAKRGTTIMGYFAELLNDSGLKSRGNDGPMGSPYIMNYRSALARLVYIAKGEGEESYTPLNTFYGFRYLELSADADVEIIYVLGEVVGSELYETGSVETSNPEVNKLFSNILWGQRGNYLSIPTDCPQRDERLGWTGDTQVFCGAASYNAYIKNFMHKWLRDARDSQKVANGAYCDVIPRVFATTNNGNAAWGDAGLIVPYRLWLMYGDTDIIAEHYDSMEYYMEYLSTFGLEGPNTAYGDWLNYDVTDKRYIAVCYYAYDASLMIHFSKLLGKTDREEYYTDLRRRIVAHFTEKYIDGDGLTMKTQTAYLLALKFDLLTPALRERTIKLLEQKIIDNNYTLSTGFVGTGILNQTLSELGLDGLCYSLLLQTADPSWLYSVRQGATTVWERWNSYTLEKGFGNVGMNSFNHYAYGAVAEWMYSKMAGISPDVNNPGFGHFLLTPTPDTRTELPAGQEKITFVKAHYESIRGRIEAAWDMREGKFVYTVKIPEGTSATVYFPMINGADKISVNGVQFEPTELAAKVVDGKAVFELGAGEYVIA